MLVYVVSLTCFPHSRAVGLRRENRDVRVNANGPSVYLIVDPGCSASIRKKEGEAFSLTHNFPRGKVSG